MSVLIRYELVLRPDEQQMEAEEVTGCPEFYVWDHVAVALHVDEEVPLLLVLLALYRQSGCFSPYSEEG